MTENRAKIRLLLVDDEIDYLDVLAKRLTRRGLSVSKAGSGAEALRILRERVFDAAILDLKMEDMDGIEVLKVFHAMDPDMAVIMLTGHGSEQAARDGMNLGAFDYLTKPCDLEHLLERVNAAMEVKMAGT